MADTITVTKLAKRTGMESGWPQEYEIAVTPAPGRPMPELPFLHKGDGITAEDGTLYWVESAKQVPLKTERGTWWSWIYRATRDTSNDPEPWDDTPLDSQFGR